jgi:hypothetical protein
VKGHRALSPFRAPFGSFDYADNLELSELYDFIGACERKLRQLQVSQIVIKHPPVYAERLTLVPVFLVNLGYRISNAEVGAYIKVDDKELSEKLDAWPTRKRKQAQQWQPAFKVLDHRSVGMIYDFISNARIDRGFSLSMDKKSLMETVTACKPYFHLFGVYRQGVLVAAAISIRVSKEVLYNFYLAHSKDTDKFSPVVILIEGIYGWCRERNIQWLDLGTSALEDKPNFSLLEFKLRLGAVPVSKFTFSKELK